MFVTAHVLPPPPPLLQQKRARLDATSCFEAVADLQLPAGMKWRLAPNSAKYIEMEPVSPSSPSAAASIGSAHINRFWLTTPQLQHINYVCTARPATTTTATTTMAMRTSNMVDELFGGGNGDGGPGSGRNLIEVLSNYSKLWHEMLAFHIRTQHAIQSNGLIYPCFLDWFGRRMLEKVALDAYFSRMHSLAEFLAKFNVFDFEYECTQSGFILHEWRKFLNPREECFRAERATLTNIAKSIIAVKQMKLYLHTGLQDKQSLYLAFSAAVFTHRNVNSHQAGRRIVQYDLDRRVVVEQGLRNVAPAIAKFLTLSEQRKVAAAFRFSEEISAAFAVNAQTKLECEQFLLNSLPQLANQQELVSRIHSSKFQSTYTFLLLRAAAYPKKQTLGKAALLAELGHKVLSPQELPKQIVKALARPKEYERYHKCDSWVVQKLGELRALDKAGLLDAYLESKLQATLPEFLALFQLQQALAKSNLLHQFDWFRAEMSQQARTSLRSWENIRIKLLEEFAQLHQVRVELGKIVV
ncbi:hypothetical protein BASA81_002763 [Batrachochytrium salamandrivorans]|nr:hypothetical protein BASA81_002763 [Batrachochytrium salamandrivorans]